MVANTVERESASAPTPPVAGAPAGNGHEDGMSTGQIITGIVIFGTIMLLTLGIMLYGVFTEDRRR